MVQYKSADSAKGCSTDFYRPPTMISNRLPNYLLIMGVMNEIPKQLGLKGKHSKMG
jgi:hypothetical protein